MGADGSLGRVGEREVRSRGSRGGRVGSRRGLGSPGVRAGRSLGSPVGRVDPPSLGSRGVRGRRSPRVRMERVGVSIGVHGRLRLGLEMRREEGLGVGNMLGGGRGRGRRGMVVGMSRRSERFPHVC